MMRRTILAALLLAPVACSPSFDHVEWTTLSPLPKGATLGPTSVTLPAGGSVATRATAFDSSGMQLGCEPVLTSGDDHVLHIEPATRGSDALRGIAIGSTRVTVTCDGETLDLGARVIAPP